MKFWCICLILLSCSFGNLTNLYSQSYTGIFSGSLWHVDLETLGCDCEVEPYVNTFFYDNGVTFSPEGGFYAGDGNMLLIDPITGLSSVAFTPPPGAPTTVSGLVSTGGGIFYKMDQPEFG